MTSTVVNGTVSLLVYFPSVCEPSRHIWRFGDIITVSRSHSLVSFNLNTEALPSCLYGLQPQRRQLLTLTPTKQMLHKAGMDVNYTALGPFICLFM